MRASTSALDAEDQDQEETPIPGAHNCPPARLFYRTFDGYVYFLFTRVVRELNLTARPTVFSGVNCGFSLVPLRGASQLLEHSLPAQDLQPNTHIVRGNNRRVNREAYKTLDKTKCPSLALRQGRSRCVAGIVGRYRLFRVRNRRPAQANPTKPIRNSVE